LARGFELSSNTVMGGVYENYKDNPSKFVNHVNSYGFNKKLNMDFEGEGRPLFLNQAIKAGLIFPSMDGIWYGCNTNADPLFYNAVANNGVR
jgi:cell division protein FtsI (penicillin-binding protein 3)